MRIFNKVYKTTRRNYTIGIVLNRSILIDKKGVPFDEADMCVELLREMKTPFLILSSEEKSHIKEAKEISSLLGLKKELDPENVATYPR